MIIIMRFLLCLLLLSSFVAAAPQLSAIDFMGGTKTVSIEQQYENAEEGSVVWDASRSESLQRQQLFETMLMLMVLETEHII